VGWQIDELAVSRLSTVLFLQVAMWMNINDIHLRGLIAYIDV